MLDSNSINSLKKIAKEHNCSIDNIDLDSLTCVLQGKIPEKIYCGIAMSNYVERNLGDLF